MIRIAITAEAFNAVASTLPLSSVTYEAVVTAEATQSRNGETDAISREALPLDGIVLLPRTAFLSQRVRARGDDNQVAN
jgi:hypothetical protein